MNYRIFALMLCVIADAAIAIILFFSLWSVMDFIKQWSNPWVSLVCTVTIFLGLLAISFFFLFLANRNLRSVGPGGASGLALLLCLAISFLQFFLTISASILVFDTKNSLIADEDFSGAKIHKIGNGKLVVEGPIGKDFANKVIALSTPSEPVNSIELTSEGGYVDEALTLANYIEENRISVSVPTYCMSACILIAVAAPNSMADEGAIFGFHSVYPTGTSYSELSKLSLTQGKIASQKFLKSHGVSQAIIDKSSTYPADEVLEVSAKEMLDMGAISGVTKDGVTSLVGHKNEGQTNPPPPSASSPVNLSP